MSKEYIMVVKEEVANAMAYLFGNILTFVEVQAVESQQGDMILLGSPRQKVEEALNE